MTVYNTAMSDPKRKKSQAHIRMIRILKMVRTGNHTPDSLALELNVSRRTVFRDLSVLRQEGLIKEYDDIGRNYRLDRDFFLHSAHLTFQEALAVHKLCQSADEHEKDFTFREVARTAGIKIAQILPYAVQNYLRSMDNLVSRHEVPKHHLGNKYYIFESLLEALHKRKVVLISYKSPAEPQSFDTNISIYYIFFSRRAWYAVAFSSLHQEIRTFHIGRIIEMRILDRDYTIPATFNIEKYFRNAWHMIPEQKEEDTLVVLKFSQKVAQNVYEVLWHKTQKASFDSEGRLDFRVTVTGLNEISWWILGYGNEVEVIEPLKLRTIIRNTVIHLAQKYDILPDLNPPHWS
ncbi:MAG: WYL domain-containing protein [Planctomycetaceae bacterium]|jgi:proteasome accessory factor B|nr:WYL domain-containing protein [Planctomycetaceae bacterium]